MKKRTWALVVGTIRGDLYFRIVMIKLCDLRYRGVLEKIIYSTWEGEIDKFPGLRDELNELGIILVESPYIDEVTVAKYTGIGYARQREVIANGIKKIPNDVFVLKLRTDGDRWIDRILKVIDNDVDITVKRYGSFPLIYDAKFAINFINFRHMLYGYDQYYFASKETINKLTVAMGDAKIRDCPLCTETRTLCGYAYVFYELLREIWNIIPGNFYDQLWAYCRKKEESNLVLPKLVHRVFATVCVYIYTQVYFAGEDKETEHPIQLIDLFRDKIRTNSQIKKIVFGEIVDSNLAYIFKDELRKVSLYSPDVRSYTYEEYEELRHFCEKELGNKNLIKPYPYIGENKVNCEVYFINDKDNEKRGEKAEKTLQVELLPKESNYNYFRYNLEKNKKYTIRLKGIQSSSKQYTAGIFEFGQNIKVKYDEYNVSELGYFRFVTGENIGQAAFLVYAGVHGKTSGEQLRISSFEIITEDVSIDKYHAGRIMLRKYNSESYADKLINTIDDNFDFDGWKLYLKTQSFQDESEVLSEEILKFSTYDRNPAALSEYAAKLKIKPEFYDSETYAHNFKFLPSIFNMGLNAKLIVSIYNYLYNYHKFLSTNSMDVRALMLTGINRLFSMLCAKYTNLLEVPSVYEFEAHLVRILYEFLGIEKITPKSVAVADALFSIAKEKPFADVFIKKLRENGYDELVAKITAKWPAEKSFVPDKWLVSKEVMDAVTEGDIEQITEAVAHIKGKADAQLILNYYCQTYFDMSEEVQKKIDVTIDKISKFFDVEPFLIKVLRFTRTNKIVLLTDDLANRANFIFLLEMLYRRKLIGLQHESLNKMCFNDTWRRMILYTFERLENDDRLSFFTMKNSAEIWFHYVPYLRGNGKKLTVFIDAKGRSWPFLKRRNISSFAGFIKLRGQGIFLSVELSSSDKEESSKLVQAAGFDIEGQSGNLFRLICHQIDFDNAEKMYEAINRALDEFCVAGEKLVTELGNVEA